MIRTSSFVVALVGLVGLAAQPAMSANVKVTPLGSIDGEFCLLDRAMVFEDPDGTRILYDAGITVRGPDDPRLGKIDGVLLSHIHWDHLGPAHAKAANAGACNNPDRSVKDAPSSNTEKIVIAKKAKFFVGGEMNSFFAKAPIASLAASRSGACRRFIVMGWTRNFSRATLLSRWQPMA
jgi:mRNA degradation ribonuclease J1/J2